jgi:hypothetical protein
MAVLTCRGAELNSKLITAASAANARYLASHALKAGAFSDHGFEGPGSGLGGEWPPARQLEETEALRHPLLVSYLGYLG